MCALYKVPLHMACLHFVEHLSCVVMRGVLDVLVVFLRLCTGWLAGEGRAWRGESQRRFSVLWLALTGTRGPGPYSGGLTGEGQPSPSTVHSQQLAGEASTGTGEPSLYSRWLAGEEQFSSSTLRCQQLAGETLTGTGEPSPYS